MRTVLMVAMVLVALAICQVQGRAHLKRRQADEDAERVEPRDPVIIIDTPRQYDGFDADSEDEDDDDFFGSLYPGFRQRPMFDMEWVAMMQRRIAMMNALLDRLFNRRTQFPPDVFSGGDFDNLPPDYDNSTFTTKVVNGSLVSVNETVKKHQTNSSTFFFHFRTVQVKPLNDTEEVDGNVPTVGDTTVPPPPTRFTEPTSAPDVDSNDVNVARRFKRLASELDVLERNINDLARDVQ